MEAFLFPISYRQDSSLHDLLSVLNGRRVAKERRNSKETTWSKIKGPERLITSWQIDGEIVETVANFILEGFKITADGDCSHEIKKTLTLWKKSYEQPRQHIEKQRHDFANRGPSSQGYGFSSGHVWMWELDYKEGWAPENWCFWTVVLEKTLESPLDSKEIQPIHPKGNQSWIFIGRTDVEAESPILWPPDAKTWLTGKDPCAGKDWRQEEKGPIEDEMVGWHHWLDGHEFE